MATYDRRDPGTDHDYTDGLSPRYTPPVARRPTRTTEHTMHDLHKAMSEALTLTIDSSAYATLAVAARNLLNEIEGTVRRG